MVSGGGVGGAGGAGAGFESFVEVEARRVGVYGNEEKLGGEGAVLCWWCPENRADWIGNHVLLAGGGYPLVVTSEML